jgi:hypothetical protein
VNSAAISKPSASAKWGDGGGMSGFLVYEASRRQEASLPALGYAIRSRRVLKLCTAHAGRR